MVGNKIDLIENDKENDKNQVKESDESRVKENEESLKNKENIENKENKENKENVENKEIKENNQKIEYKENNELDEINNKNYNKQTTIEKENFDLTKNISGLNGFYLEDLLKETALLLYKYIKNMENATSVLYQIEGDSIIIENKLDIDKRQTSYHDVEYKKEVNKINKQNNKICCLVCNIF